VSLWRFAPKGYGGLSDLRGRRRSGRRCKVRNLRTKGVSAETMPPNECSSSKGSGERTPHLESACPFTSPISPRAAYQAKLRCAAERLVLVRGAASHRARTNGATMASMFDDHDRAFAFFKGTCTL